jgi:hypothetical protein
MRFELSCTLIIPALLAKTAAHKLPKFKASLMSRSINSTMFVVSPFMLHQERRKIMKKTLFVVVVVTIFGSASAQNSMPILKNGSCPSGYSSQGNMCSPNANAKPAIPRSGSCPSGWSTQGNYCLANSANPKNAILRSGSCPSGYSQQSNYCLQN